MRILLLAAAASIPIAALPTTPAAAQGGPPVCQPGHPTDPNSEEGNPGFGGTTGLNDDFHDEFDDPLDHPGQVIGPANREAAQSGEPGGNHLLQDLVGNDCPKS